MRNGAGAYYRVRPARFLEGIMDKAELSTLIDAWGEARKKRLEAKREMDRLEVEEKKLKAQVIREMSLAKASSHGGQKYGANYSKKDKPTAGNWPKIYAWIKKNDGFDILQRRLTESAIELRREDKIIIPGIVMFPVEDITLFTP